MYDFLSFYDCLSKMDSEELRLINFLLTSSVISYFSPLLSLHLTLESHFFLGDIVVWLVSFWFMFHAE